MTGGIAFLFPGQGSQAAGMGRALAEQFPIAAQTFAEADEALGFSLSGLCFNGPEEDLRLTENTQPAILDRERGRVAGAGAARRATGAGRGTFAGRVVGARGRRHARLCRCGARREGARTRHAAGRSRRSGSHGRGAGPGCGAGGRGLRGGSARDRADRGCRESELAESDGHLRCAGGRGEGCRAGQGQRRAASRDAAGERAFSLRADAARTGGSCAGAGRARRWPIRAFPWPPT